MSELIKTIDSIEKKKNSLLSYSILKPEKDHIGSSAINKKYKMFIKIRGSIKNIDSDFR